MIQRLLRRLRTLQWRLTLSYVLVTVATLLVLQGALLAAVYFFYLNSPFLGQQLASSLSSQDAPQVAPYLLQTVPDHVALTAKLENFLSNKGEAIFGGLNNGGAGIISSVMVLAPDGSITDEVHITSAYAPTRTIAAIGGATALQRLAHGSAHIIATLPTGASFIAVPVQNIDGSALGIFAITINLPEVRFAFLSLAVRTFLPSAIVLTIISTVIGTLFGVFVSRGLRRRVGHITTAADAWSQGDFTAQVPDAAGDELGALARHLNGMVDQVQTLLATRQTLAVVDERNRLARDLHDSVKQQIFATAMQLAAARALIATDPATAEQRLAAAQDLVSQAQLELTGLIGELRPAALGDRGLVAALSTLGEEWSRRSNIAFDLHTQGAQATPLVVEQTLFRVAQEALSNISRHSGATHADLHLAWASAALTCTIHDDGHGFDAAANSKGLGLRSMRERVEALGGLFAVASTASGTRITIQVPLAQLVLHEEGENGTRNDTESTRKDAEFESKSRVIPRSGSPADGATPRNREEIS
jgi:NarL family two-component system sensor histidine kinase LiaS